jgi:hypothetical protein
MTKENIDFIKEQFSFIEKYDEALDRLMNHEDVDWRRIAALNDRKLQALKNIIEILFKEAIND